MDSSSDSDDCQLYTRTADNIAKKKMLLDEDRNELALRMKLLPDDQVSGYSQVFEKLYDSQEPSIVSEVASLHPTTDSEDDMPLSELRDSLTARFGRNKQKTAKLGPKPKKKKKQTRNRVTTNNIDCVLSTPSNIPNTNEIPTIVFDDDTGYPTTSFAPITFNRVSKKGMPRPSTEDDDIISLDELQSNYDDNDEDLDTLVKISIDWRVKSESLGFNIKHFQLRRYQKFETIFEELAEMEGVPVNRVVIMRNFETIRPRDTPASLNLTYYGHLIGRVSNTEVDHNLPKLSDFDDDHSKKPLEEELEVKLLLDSKTSISLKISKTQKMNILYKKCSEELKVPDSKIKISFDGEVVERQESVSDLGIEDGDVFEVLIKKGS